MREFPYFAAMLQDQVLLIVVLLMSVSLLSILSIWAVVFYFKMLDEVKNSIDDGLDNYKMLIIYKAQQDSGILQPDSFNNNNYFIREVSPEYAAGVRDEFKDTLIYRPRTEAPERRWQSSILGTKPASVLCHQKPQNNLYQAERILDESENQQSVAREAPEGNPGINSRAGRRLSSQF